MDSLRSCRRLNSHGLCNTVLLGRGALNEVTAATSEEKCLQTGGEVMSPHTLFDFRLITFWHRTMRRMDVVASADAV